MEAMNSNINEAAYHAAAHKAGNEMLFAIVLVVAVGFLIMGFGYVLVQGLIKISEDRKMGLEAVKAQPKPNTYRNPPRPRHQR